MHCNDLDEQVNAVTCSSGVWSALLATFFLLFVNSPHIPTREQLSFVPFSYILTFPISSFKVRQLLFFLGGFRRNNFLSLTQALPLWLLARHKLPTPQINSFPTTPTTAAATSSHLFFFFFFWVAPCSAWYPGVQSPANVRSKHTSAAAPLLRGGMFRCFVALLFSFFPCSCHFLSNDEVFTDECVDQKERERRKRQSVQIVIPFLLVCGFDSKKLADGTKHVIANLLAPHFLFFFLFFWNSPLSNLQNKCTVRHKTSNKGTTWD